MKRRLVHMEISVPSIPQYPYSSFEIYASILLLLLFFYNYKVLTIIITTKRREGSHEFKEYYEWLKMSVRLID